MMTQAHPQPVADSMPHPAETRLDPVPGGTRTPVRRVYRPPVCRRLDLGGDTGLGIGSSTDGGTPGQGS